MKALLLALTLVALVPDSSSAQASHLLVIVGLGGDAETAARFHEWAVRLVDSARERGQLPAESVIYLGEDPARDSKRMSGRATREAVQASVEKLAARARPGDRVVVVLIGHGASASGESKFNLPGRDLSVAEFSKLMERFRGQTLAFVNTASASGSFLGPLSGRERVVITATKGDGERNQTRFPEYFVEALTSADADLDKDGRVSMLEAFTFARQRTAASYEQDGQLLTEHALLDDDGDGKGTDAPGPEKGDGALARTVFLDAGDAGRAGPPPDADPALRTLYEERRALEERIAALKASRDRLEAGQYQQELERLLLELARKSREIREKEKR